MTRMSEMMQDHNIPRLTLGWRLKMALGDMPAHEMADALEVARGTVSRWMADKGTPPRSVFIRQWALITRTDPNWLLTGQQEHPHAPGAVENTRGYDGDVLEFRRPVGQVRVKTVPAAGHERVNPAA